MSTATDAPPTGRRPHPMTDEVVALVAAVRAVAVEDGERPRPRRSTATSPASAPPRPP